MSYLKKSWEKEKQKEEIPREILEKMGARGSFVTVKTDRLFKELDEKIQSESYSKQGLDIVEQINEKTAEIYYTTWINNLTENLPTIKQDNNISEIQKWKRKTAIIIGAGPSFKEKKHIEFLKKNNDKTIISTDRMLIPLLKEGVEPDFVVSLDGLEIISQFYDDPLVNKNISTQAIMSVTVSPSLIKRFPNKIYFYTPMLDTIEKPISVTNTISQLTKTSVIASGGNVGITCINIAYYLGYKNILFTGMDQGYTSKEEIGKSSHYLDIKEEDSTMTLDKYMELFITEGYNPDFDIKYYTDLAWKPQIDTFIERSTIIAKNGVNLINTTGGGALHGGGIVGMSLGEALKKYD